MAAAILSGCAQLDYYAHLARGQWQLLSQREAIAAIVADPQRDAGLRQRLQRVQDARRYAADALALPDNGSYTRYVDLKRDAVVWNVFATPEFSLDAVESCFPIAGCLAYRGFYDRARAERYAASLREQGYETHIGDVAAYSTLGWFDDPLLNTMMRWSDAHLIGTLFHELAHQKLFVKNDTAFNESFASFVEQQGLSQYSEQRALNTASEVQREARSREFVALVLAARERLKAVYAQKLPAEAMRVRKQAEFAQLKTDYRALRDGAWQGYAGYDNWFEQALNNAVLLPFGLYDEWVPAFAALWQREHRDWPAFYRATKALGALKPEVRRAQLKQLAAEPRP